MLRRVIGVSLALTVSFGASALAQHGGYTHASSAAAQGKPGEDPVVARVDGVEIRRSELVIAMESLPPQYRQMPMQMLYTPLLNQLVDRKLIAAQAEKEKLGDNAEVQRRLAVQRERVLQEAFLARELSDKVTEDRLRKHYDKTMKDSPRDEEVRARHILVESEADAKKLSAEAKGGADFGTLAKANSKDPGAANGGDLGFFKRDQMVPEFATAAFAMKVGEISSPVKTAYGWHVIKVEERRAAKAPSFEESVDEMKEQVAEEVVGEMLAGLRSKAKVETFNFDGTPLPAQPAPNQPVLAPQQKR